VPALIYISAHKEEIVDKVKIELAEKLNGKVEIGNIDLTYFKSFPNISVQLQNVSIKDTLFDQHKHPFFSGLKMFCSH
jgi:hypothetical protein